MCTVHHHLQCACCLLIPFFTVLQVQHGVQHNARAEKAPPCARFVIYSAPVYLSSFFTVLQVQHGVQHDARAEKAPPCVHGSSSFTVPLFIYPPFLQCSKCSMEYNTMHELRKHHHVCTVHHHLQFVFINPPFLQCSKCSMEYNTMHELRKHRRVHGSSSFTVRLFI